MTAFNARKTGLTDDDLRAMHPDELELWLELNDWVNTRDEDDGMAEAERSRNAFFHL